MTKRRATHAVCLAACLLVGCSGRPEPAPDKRGKVGVTASIFPLADVAAQIGGPDAAVTCMLAPGQSPHAFAARPEHVEMLTRAKLLVRVGLGVDDWAAQAATAAGKGLRVVVFADLVGGEAGRHDPDHDGHPGEDHDEAHGHHHAGDPHIWLDPVFTQELVKRVAEELAAIDPAHREGYLRRRDAYLAKLRQLDADYRQVLSAVPKKHFVTFHEAFTYIARRYGLVAQSLAGVDAEALGPDRLGEVVAFVKAHRVAAIFVEPQFPVERLQAVADRTGVRVEVLDPLGSPAAAGYDGYLAMMRSNLARLAASLKE